VRTTYGGNARFGRRSMRISSSLGGGIRFSGDHTLMGVFQGTTGFETSSGPGGAVDAWRNAGKRWRHCNCGRGRARRIAGSIRGGGIVDVCVAQWTAGEKCMVTRSVDAWRSMFVRFARGIGSEVGNFTSICTSTLYTCNSRDELPHPHDLRFEFYSAPSYHLIDLLPGHLT
jgi:hypothetical protein